MTATKRHLVGRTIVDVEWNRFSDGRAGGGQMTADPRLVLDNGRKVYFLVHETDVGEYGIDIGVTALPKRT